MEVLPAISRSGGVHIAEVGFLLLVIAGIWQFAAEIGPERWRRIRRVVSGLLIAAAGVLLIVAARWGHFG